MAATKELQTLFFNKYGQNKNFQLEQTITVLDEEEEEEEEQEKEYVSTRKIILG